MSVVSKLSNVFRTARLLTNEELLGPKPRKNSGSHIDASHSRQPLVKGERLVRNEVNAVMNYDFFCGGGHACSMRAALPSHARGASNQALRCLAALWACRAPGRAEHRCTSRRAQCLYSRTERGKWLRLGPQLSIRRTARHNQK